MLGRKLDKAVAPHMCRCVDVASGSIYSASLEKRTKLFIACDRSLPVAAAWYAATCEIWES
jgi:hypothetical protein